MRPEELEGALCAEWVACVLSQNRSPPEIVCRVIHRLMVGDTLVVLEEYGERELSWRDTWPTELIAVEHVEVLIRKQASRLQRTPSCPYT